MKRAVLNLMRMTGAFAPFRIQNRNKVLILTYHRFSSDERDEATSARAFARQLNYLRSRYSLVSLSDVARCLRGQSQLPPAPAVITIDDGYRDAYEIALPLLRRYGAPATIFVVTDFIDGKIWLWTDKARFLAFNTRAERLEVTVADSALDIRLKDRASRLGAADRINSLLKSLPDEAKERAISDLSRQFGVELPATPPGEYGPLSWSEIHEMRRCGVEVGSHTVTHPLLTRVTGERLDYEMCESRRRLQSVLGCEAETFCYPNGDYNLDARQAAERAGYAAAVTTEAGLNGASSDPLALRRIHTESDLARFVQSTSGFEQIKHGLRRAGVRRAATPPMAVSERYE